MSPCVFFSLSPCLLVILLLGLKLAKEPSPERLLQEGQQASARGDYERAAGLYEQAEMYSRDPAEAAFYLAGATYHLAEKTEGPSPELLEAEQWYRCCLEPSDPRRPRALLGLGNCLLHKAGTHDEASLRAGLACYDQCLQSAGDDTTLAADARYNREKARLLLLQFPPANNSSSSDRPSSDDFNSQPPHSDNRQAMRMPPGDSGTEGDTDPNAQSRSVKPNEGASASKSNSSPPPGKGNLPPISDETEARPLSPHEASEDLQLAAKKVLQERQIHHRRGENPTFAGVKDW
ncbi:MAG TPA: tetratricopeptide repeat protein [Gemmataceae bacterium]|nr:tetratricopeptide repeat protein [Gemmataceae bacterium]